MKNQIAFYIIIHVLFDDLLRVHALCPDKPGWEDTGDKCIQVFDSKKDWIAANYACKEKSGKLFSVHSLEQQEKLLDVTNGKDYWIGGHIPALVFKSNFDRCADGHDFRKKSCFQILPEKLSWKKARDTCQELGGRLASIGDEETNIFVGEAMVSMATKRDDTKKPVGKPDDAGADGRAREGKDKNDPPFSYWIDGHSDGGTLDFVDSEERPLEYTNFMPSTVQNGKSCLQVFPESKDQPLDDLEKQLLDATAAALEAAMDNLTSAALDAIPETLTDVIPQSTVASYSSSNYSTYDSNPLAPQYDISSCEQSLMAVCQFALRVIENETSTEKDEEKGKNSEPPPRPSHISSCENLALLSLYSERSDSSERQGRSKDENDLLTRFRDLENNYYIIESDEETASGSNSSASSEITQFELRHCNIAALRNSIQDDPANILQLFKWLSGAKDDDWDDNTITSLGLVDEEEVYEGPCIFASAEEENWNPSLCSEKRSYICEYSVDTIRENFCGDEKDKEKEWCKPSDSLQKLTEDSHSLLESLQGEPIGVSTDILTAAADHLRRLVLEAKLSVLGISVPTTTVLSVENFTSTILNVASVLLHPGTADLTAEQSTERSLISTVNILGEYVADTLKLLKEAEEGDEKNATMLFVTSPRIRLRIYAVTNQTARKSLDAYSFFGLDTGERIRMILSPAQRYMSESQGVAFINVQYRDLGTAMHAPQSLNAMADDLALDREVSSETFASNDTTGKTYTKGTTYTMLATNILTATMRINGTNYPTDVQFSMPKKNLATGLEIIPNSEMCAFLPEEEENEAIGLHWSGRGCYRVRGNEADNKYHCECNHTTDFAVLLLVFQPEEDILKGHREILFILTIVGHILSIVCLLIASLLFVALKRELKSERRIIHVNLFIALLLANSILVLSQLTNRSVTLSGLDDTEKSGTDATCITLTFFSHFLLLTSLFWMLVEGIVIYRKIVVVLSRQIKSFSKAYYIIGWGIPLVISGAAIAVGMLTGISYNTEGCWLAIRSGMIWAFAGPAIAIILVNTVIVCMVLRVALRAQKRKFARRTDIKDDEKTKNRVAYLKTAARGLMVLTPLLGLTWMCGLLIFHVSVAYVFVILNAFQGVSIFICYCVWNPEVRSALGMKLRHYRARRFSPMHEDKFFHLNDHAATQAKPSLKTRLFMRLSFSTTSSPHDKSNSDHNNSQGMEERHQDKELRENFAEDLSPMTSLPPSPSSHGSRVGTRNSSASTRSTYFSNHSFSSSSLRDGALSVVKKMSSKVRPMSADHSFRKESEERRPSTADAVMESHNSNRPVVQETHADAVAGTGSEPVIRHRQFRRRFKSEHFSNDSEGEFISECGPTDYRSLQPGKRRTSPLRPDCGVDNPALEVESGQEPKETEYSSTIVDDGIKATSRINDWCNRQATSAKVTSRKHKDDQTCNPCCKQYYNVFLDEAPPQLYSNAWSRRPKSTKRLQSAKKRPVQGRRKTTISRGDISVTRCCPNCNSPKKRPNISNGNRKRAMSSGSWKLDVVDLSITGEDKVQSHQSRSSSRESGDSGILPDELGEC